MRKTTLLFGDGKLLVGDRINTQSGSGQFRVVESNTAFPIGALTQDVQENLTEYIIDNVEIVMDFTNIESLDVVIRRLNALRSKMIRHGIAQEVQRYE